MPKLSYRLLLIGLVLCSLLAVGCQSTTDETRSPGEIEANQGQSTAITQLEERELTGEEITLSSIKAYKDLFGEWVVVGLIHNSSDYPVGNVILQLQFFNANNK